METRDGQTAWRSALFEGFSLNWRTKCSSRGLPTEVQSVLFGREAAWRLRYQSCVLAALRVMLVDREAAWRWIWQTSKGTWFFVFVGLEDCQAVWRSALFKRISLNLGDGRFFIGKSKSPPIEAFGTSLMEAMGGRGFQVRLIL